MLEIKAPNGPTEDISDKFVLFLGGSIDMGTAEPWQDRLIQDISDHPGTEDLVILNPRRPDWDATWKQDPTPGTPFYEQVRWELDAQEFATDLIYYFAADSKAPITLLELGLFADSVNALVCCPKTFYRYGNVKMVCDRYHIPIVESYEDMLAYLKAALTYYHKQGK